jgi:hypothetical protein
MPQAMPARRDAHFVRAITPLFRVSHKFQLDSNIH